MNLMAHLNLLGKIGIGTAAVGLAVAPGRTCGTLVMGCFIWVLLIALLIGLFIVL